MSNAMRDSLVEREKRLENDVLNLRSQVSNHRAQLESMETQLDMVTGRLLEVRELRAMVLEQDRMEAEKGGEPKA